MLFLRLDKTKFIKLEKARKDLTKLIKKQVVDKNGHIKTVWVKVVETVKVRMRSYANNLFNNYFAMGFSYRFGEIKETSLKSLQASKKMESEIVNAEIEHCGAFNSEGKLIFTKKGEYDKIEFYKSEVNIFKNSEIFTHNHPEDKSFSMEDIFMAISTGIKEIRIISPNYIYSLNFSHKEKSNNDFELVNKYQYLFNKIDKHEHDTSLHLEEMKESGFLTSNEIDIVKDKIMLKNIVEDKEINDMFNMKFTTRRRQ